MGSNQKILKQGNGWISSDYFWKIFWLLFGGGLARQAAVRVMLGKMSWWGYGMGVEGLIRRAGRLTDLGQSERTSEKACS